MRAAMGERYGDCHPSSAWSGTDMRSPVHSPLCVDRCQEAALAVVELLDVLLDELLPESGDFAAGADSLLPESDFDESLELDSLLVVVERLSLR